MIFTGEYNAKLNAKNQVTLPAPLREAIFFDSDSVQLVLFCKEAGNLIEIFLGDAWLEKQKEIELLAKKRNDPTLNRRFNRLAYAFVMDKTGNGRILIPPAFVKFLSPNGDLTFLGNTSKIEIWNTNSLDQQAGSENELSLEDMSSIFDY